VCFFYILQQYRAIHKNADLMLSADFFLNIQNILFVWFSRKFSRNFRCSRKFSRKFPFSRKFSRKCQGFSRKRIFSQKRKIFAKRNFAKFRENLPIFAWFSHFRENIKSHFRFNPRFQRCHWHRCNQFSRLLKRLSRRIRNHMRNGFSPWVRALGGVDWWTNQRSKISWRCPFNIHIFV
jgi:hypothetical protein